jgi:hypothetical protein
MLASMIAGRVFDPRRIAGCIFNLDASVVSSLFQNSDGTTAATAANDPVGYATDLSGSGNHAKQTIATGSRPFLKLNNQNGLPGLLFDGSNDFLTATIANFQSLTAATIIQVVKPTAAAAADTSSAQFWGFGNVSAASGSYPANKMVGLSSSTGVLSGERITAIVEPPVNGRLGSSSYSRSASTAQLLASTLTGSGFSLYANNSAVSFALLGNATSSSACAPSDTGYTVDNDLHISAIRASGSLAYSAESTLHQMLVYNRALSTDELTAIWHAMRGKWGIT